MKISSTIRTGLIALVALIGLSSASVADSGDVRLTIYKAGWIIGGSGGGGTLYFRGRTYRVVNRRAGLWSRLRRFEDGAGRKGAATSTARRMSRASMARPAWDFAVGRGARAIVLRNQKGAILELSGRQVGLLANADLSGLAITLK